MDTGRNDLLGEIAVGRRPGALATSSSRRPTSSAASSTATRSASPPIGGLTLIDEDPDYLSIAPD